ncbi:defense protein l(2)34Fc-like [Rhopalosiphum maidis]|uniref:defense protein l(2)34Fc-like n=1 Tax=Rhopalosiphum maidis TaxID=43146 RepID=UPI000F000BA2|nr:defense protein l(2)34Fc-like [Rhopalosiphum maidis]
MVVEIRLRRAGATRTSVQTATALLLVFLLQAPGTRAVTDDMLKIACSDMTPRHPGYRPENVQGVPCPYRLMVDPSTPVVPGNLVNLTLTSVGTTMPFKGFMVQARDVNGRAIGTFLPECRNATKHHMITCSNGEEPYNAVVQSNNKYKLKDTFTWIAPLSLKGSFRFKFTVVLNFEHFWTNQETEDIPVAKLSKEEFELKNSFNHEYYIYNLYIQNCFV